MARIRTIKPEFFTSADIVALTPMARLLYVALWCEADREARMVWKPATFKLRYFPGDSCDVYALCAELTDAGLIVLYGEGFAHIPSFTAHQHINPRESVSQLPDPHASGTRKTRVGTREARDSDAQGGREGKGREGGKARKTPNTPLSPDFKISERVKAWAEAGGHRNLQAHFDALVSYAKRKGATYADWDEALMEAVRKDWGKTGLTLVDDRFAGAI